MSIVLADELTLPDDAVTETFALLAKRGAGKSNAAVLMAEGMFDSGLPWVAVDPKGDWWGVRSSKDGTGAGLSVVVFGGEHADVPLEPGSGAFVADLLVDNRFTAVLDVSLMSKSDMRRFLADFADRLYRRNREPLHVFAEEAHEYIPQRVTAADAPMVGAWERLVKWGRTHGLGVTLITQRSASLNKDVLTQVETLIALRTTAPHDQAAIKAWVDEHESGAGLITELRKLPAGGAFVLSPGWLELDGPLRIQFRQRRTFDSGATPKAGQRRINPRTVADVDLAAIKDAMADTIDRAAADDPAQLQARVDELERQLAESRHVSTEEPLRLIRHVQGGLVALEATLNRVVESLLGNPDARPNQQDSEDRTSAVREYIGALQNGGAEQLRRDGHGTSRPAADAAPAPEANVKIGRAERTVLSVLVLHGPTSHSTVALLAGYSAKASTVGVALSKLRRAGLVEEGQPLRATQAGRDLLGGEVEPLPTGKALIDYWVARFGSTEGKVLKALIGLYPRPGTQAEVAQMTGYSPTASTVGVAMSKLRRVGVVDGWALSHDFARAAKLR